MATNKEIRPKIRSQFTLNVHSTEYVKPLRRYGKDKADTFPLPQGINDIDTIDFVNSQPMSQPWIN